MPGLRWQSYLRWDLMDELEKDGIEVFYNSPTVSRDDSKCENEHSYEGHESGAPYMSLTEEEGEDKDVEKDAEKDAERDNDEDDTQEEKSFPFRPHGPIQRYFLKA
jgi:hypothetical protein